MKLKRVLILLTPFLAITGFAAASDPSPAANKQSDYSIIERGPNYRIVQRTTFDTLDGGKVVPHSDTYTELATGMHYQAPNGQWLQSDARIEPTPGRTGGAEASHGQHKIHFPYDIYQGVIETVTPDGQRLKSRPVSIWYSDGTNSALIAVLTNSVGQLTRPNEVVYPNAFDGAQASIRYRYTKAGFEQDVVIQGQLPDPAALGLDPDNTRLGILTTFFDTKNPEAAPGRADKASGLSDSTLIFGSMKMVQGRAFSIGNTEQSTGATNTAARFDSDGTPVYKRWFQSDKQRFLIEEVPYRKVAAQLGQLPARTAQLNAAHTKLWAANSFLRGLPAGLLSLPAQTDPANEIRGLGLAKATGNDLRGLVMDYYITVPGMPGDYTFHNGTTYYVSGPCDLVNATFEGGAVIKYASYSYSQWYQIGAQNYGSAYLVVEGTLNCQTSSLHPAIFTAADDDSVGAIISGSTGDPSQDYYANPAIWSPNSPDITISNVCIKYAAQGVYKSSGNLTLQDSQVIDSGTMIILGDGYGYGGAMTLTCNNCLFNGGYYGTPISDYGNTSDTYNFNNCTIDNANYLAYGSNPSSNQGNAVNCIFAHTSMAGNATWQGNHNGFYSSFTFGSSQSTTTTNPFKSSGGNNYYLTANSTWRNIGATVTGSLLADLAVGTTYAPEDGYHPDNDTIDLGYHYYATRPLAISKVVYLPVRYDYQYEDPPIPISVDGSYIYGPLDFHLESGPRYGSNPENEGIIQTASGPVLNYIPPLNYVGPDEFTFTVRYGNNISVLATISIQIGSVSLSASPASTQITLRWSDNQNAYSIGRSTGYGGPPYTVIASPPLAANGWFLDSEAPSRQSLKVDHGQTYHYVLGQINGSGTFVPISNEVSARTGDNNNNQPPSYNPSFWNDNTYVRENNDCYAYATNVRLDHRSASPGLAHSGDGYRFCSDINSCRDALTQAAIEDGLTPCQAGDPDPDLAGRTKVAMFIRWESGSFVDHHWMRRDIVNGSVHWSHKVDVHPVTDKDSNDQTITNPETAVITFTYPDTGLTVNYIFEGYFWTPAGTSEGQGNAIIQ